MPKKFVGENSKAVAARARKAEANEKDAAKRQQQLEEEYWKDDDKHIAKKQQRKEEQERRKQQQLEKKAESKALYEQEMKSIQPAVKQQQSKITRSQIQAEAEKRNKAAVATSKKPDITHIQEPLEENINRVVVDGLEARSVTEAIAVLSVKGEEVDRHPEKRLKAAYTAFEEANMPRIKAENPNLRLSQMKQLLRKEWMRSPENPLNQKLSLSKQ
ncbi:Coiled-coil domain-containing protein [Gryllus bimaculatus]|nr:Coiled-coil domain-containing protein [Gryllus bimaculatus]